MQLYLNGAIIDPSQAHISVLDRGFLFGDGVYEVVRFFDRYGVALELHTRRLARSLALAGIQGFDANTFPQICQQLLEQNNLANATIYLQVTRGVGATRSHVPTAPMTPTVVAIATAVEPLAALTAPQEITAITAEDLRWRLCEIKTISLMGNVLHLIDADAKGASEAILHRNGFVGEGAYSNVAIAVDGVLITPPVADEPPILHGTARADLLSAAQRIELPSAVRRITLDELARADEIMISSSRRLVSSVVQLDGRAIGIGHAGPISRALFHECCSDIRGAIRARAASEASHITA
ncbi:MAG: D-amino acid aminotransferase [Phycisphaerales bacterium]|nr:D-amino acid aminotransferase [Phycisphaerales bacterium]